MCLDTGHALDRIKAEFDSNRVPSLEKEEYQTH